MLSSVCFIRDNEHEDMYAIFLIRNIDYYKELERKNEAEISERQAIIDVLLAEYEGIFISNLDTGEVLYSFSENSSVITEDMVDMFDSFKNSFSDELTDFHKKMVYPEDYSEFKKCISKAYVTDMLNRQNSFVCNYRILCFKT